VSCAPKPAISYKVTGFSCKAVDHERMAGYFSDANVSCASSSTSMRDDRVAAGPFQPREFSFRRESVHVMIRCKTKIKITSITAYNSSVPVPYKSHLAENILLAVFYL
jgi:hypothetical protein